MGKMRRKVQSQTEVCSVISIILFLTSFQTLSLLQQNLKQQNGMLAACEERMRVAYAEDLQKREDLRQAETREREASYRAEMEQIFQRELAKYQATKEQEIADLKLELQRLQVSVHLHNQLTLTDH
jgi:hypothetical protein